MLDVLCLTGITPTSLTNVDQKVSDNVFRDGI